MGRAIKATVSGGNWARATARNRNSGSASMSCTMAGCPLASTRPVMPSPSRHSGRVPPPAASARRRAGCWRCAPRRGRPRADRTAQCARGSAPAARSSGAAWCAGPEPAPGCGPPGASPRASATTLARAIRQTSGVRGEEWVAWFQKAISTPACCPRNGDGHNRALARQKYTGNHTLVVDKAIKQFSV
jgi:hypothetical protein